VPPLSPVFLHRTQSAGADSPFMFGLLVVDNFSRHSTFCENFEGLELLQEAASPAMPVSMRVCGRWGCAQPSLRTTYNGRYV